MSTATLPDSDLRALFTLLEDARRDDPGEVVPWALLEGLARLIHADSVQLTELDWAGESLAQQQILIGGECFATTTAEKDEHTATYFRVSRTFRACTDPAYTDPDGPDQRVAATRFSDFYTDLELLNTDAWAEHYRFMPARTCLGVRLPCPPGRARRVVFMRSTTTDFTDRDVMLLSLLRPHLYEIYLDAERRRRGTPKLTAREWQILQLAGEGLPNSAIAERLFISPATVRKHMEHIFDTLGVHTRSEAAAIALPHRHLDATG